MKTYHDDLWEGYKNGVKKSSTNVVPPHILNKRDPKVKSLRTKLTDIENINTPMYNSIVHIIDGRIWIHTSEELSLGDRAYINQKNKQHLAMWPNLNQCPNTRSK